MGKREREDSAVQAETTTSARMASYRHCNRKEEMTNSLKESKQTPLYLKSPKFLKTLFYANLFGEMLYRNSLRWQ